MSNLIDKICHLYDIDIILLQYIQNNSQFLINDFTLKRLFENDCNDSFQISYQIESFICLREIQKLYSSKLSFNALDSTGIISNKSNINHYGVIGLAASEILKAKNSNDQRCFMLLDISQSIMIPLILSYSISKQLFSHYSIQSLIGYAFIIIRPTLQQHDEQQELSIQHICQLVIIGKATAVSFGICKGFKSNGKACKLPINLKTSSYCKYHANSQDAFQPRSNEVIQPKEKSCINVIVNDKSQSNRIIIPREAESVFTFGAQLLHEETLKRQILQSSTSTRPQDGIQRIVSKLGNINTEKSNAIMKPLINSTTNHIQMISNVALCSQLLQQNANKHNKVLENQGNKIKLQEEVKKQNDELNELLNRKSSHAKQLELEKNDIYNKRIEKLEQREFNELKQSKIESISISGMSCKTCNLFYEMSSYKAIQLCQSNKHNITTMKLIKRFYECNHCYRRTFTLSSYQSKALVLPKHVCEVCGKYSWNVCGIKGSIHSKPIDEDRLVLSNSESTTSRDRDLMFSRISAMK